MMEDHTTHELVIPDWLTEEFFEQVLSGYEKDSSIKVCSLKISRGASGNDHYSSVMYRAKIKYTNSENKAANISLIVKAMPEVEGVKKELLSESFIFKTEIRMYSETIPKMEAILRKAGDETVLGAKAIYYAMEPRQVIIFEDLVERGFSPLKGRLPTEEEVRSILLKIAKWHAVSFMLGQEDPESVNTYNDGLMNMDLEKQELITHGIKAFIDKVLMVDEDLKQYVPYFKELDKSMIDFCVEMCNGFKNGHKALFVLNHGDFHTKNMMFRHKPNGDFDEVILVDFQLCFFGTMTSDLMYAIYTLWDEDMRRNIRDELIYYYFSIFVDTLKKIEFKGELPKMVDLQMDFLKYRWFETFLIAVLFPLVLIFTDERIEMDKIMESADARTVLYSNPVYIREVKRLLPVLLQRGYLE